MGTDETSNQMEEAGVLRLSVEIISSYLANNSVSASSIPDVIRSVHESLTNVGRPEPQARPAEKQKPAVPVGRSINQDYIVCLEDGKRLKMLKRYLRSRYNLSPDDYRRKWGLPPDYPMVAPAYASRRSEFAKQIGLGRGVRRQRTGGTAGAGKTAGKTARK
jgi:predicted transcriptional regulator